MAEPNSSPIDRALRWAVASMAVLVLGLGVAIAWKVAGAPEPPPPTTRRPRPSPALTRAEVEPAPSVTLTLETVPSGATLRVDGHEVGSSPWRDTLTPGEHRVEATLTGYAPMRRTLDLADAGPTETVKLELEALAAADAGVVASVDAGTPVATAETRPTRPAVKGRGKLSLKTTPRATVYLNGRRIGDTPIVNLSVPAGTLTLRLVRADTGEEASLEVDISPNRTTARRFSF